MHSCPRPLPDAPSSAGSGKTRPPGSRAASCPSSRPRWRPWRPGEKRSALGRCASLRLTRLTLAFSDAAPAPGAAWRWMPPSRRRCRGRAGIRGSAQKQWRLLPRRAARHWTKTRYVDLHPPPMCGRRSAHMRFCIPGAVARPVPEPRRLVRQPRNSGRHQAPRLQAQNLRQGPVAGVRRACAPVCNGRTLRDALPHVPVAATRTPPG
jgi:hypothetical protein